MLLADLDVSLVHDLRDDVGAVAQVVVDEVGLAVLHLVHAELLAGRRLDVGELVVVVDRLDGERVFVLERVVELELERIRTLVLVYGLGDVALQGSELLFGLV